MNIILYYWPRDWQSVTLNVDSGAGHVRWFSRKPECCNGWALQRRGKWYAIWSTGEHLVFQAGAKQWPITQEYQCTNVLNGRTRTFTILKDGQKLFELSYRAYEYRLFQEVTFDELDLLSSDFFYSVASTWNSSDLGRSSMARWGKPECTH